MKHCNAVFFCFIFGFLLSAFGCVLESSDDVSSSGKVTQTASGSSFSANNKIYIDLTAKNVSTESASASGTSITATEALYIGETVGVSLSDSVVIKIDATDIDSNLAIYLSGTLSTGGVKIQTSTDYEIGLYLSEVTISSSNYPCIDMTKGGAVSVFLTGTNNLTDGRTYGYGYGDSASGSQNPVSTGSDSKGTLYCKGGMAISGTGSLSVTQAYKNCIASKDGYLAIESGTLTLKNYKDSTNDPISNHSSITDTGKNGLFGGQGITVSGGAITFYGCGIISTSDVRKANAFKTDDDDYTSSYVKISGGTTTVKTYNGKGINAPIIEISGGTNTFIVDGTTLNSTSRTYYDADGIKQSKTLKFSPEGIEAENSITISAGLTQIGSLEVCVPDDGINVSATGGTLTISGGILCVYAGGDGLDSNGNITISGGTTIVSQTDGGNSPIDCGDNYKFTVTATSATVFAMGSSDMFSESIPSSIVSAMIYLKKSLSGSAGTSLGVNNIIGVKSPLAYDAAILVSSSLTSGTSYSFVKGGTLSGTEILSGIYYPAAVSDGTSVSATATTSSSSGGSSTNHGGSNTPGGGPGQH